MHTLQFTTRASQDGVVEREFTVDGLPGVPGVLWSPVAALEPTAGPAPLVLLGHGGGGHKKHPAMVHRARLLAARFGFHAVAVDAPGHGDRPRSAQDEADVAELRAAQAAGGGAEGPVIVRYNARLAQAAVPEWQAVLDALQQLPEIGPEGPVGFVGIGLGTAVGVPLVAAEPRIRAAAFGPHWPDALTGAARRITVPVEFALQWDDERIPRESALALFDAFASPEKTLHANAGRHLEMPRFEAESAARFLARHLGAAA